MSDKQTPPAERPTPITDAYEMVLTKGGFFPKLILRYVKPDVARALERQLAEARELIDEIETRHAATMLHTQAIVDDANSLRDQRDRLAEALEYIASSGLSARHLERIATEALAAVKGGQQ